MQKKRILTILYILIFMLISQLQQPAEAVGVRPMSLDLEMHPGETKEFELTLVPSTAGEVVNLKLYQPVQLRTGGLTYQEADPDNFPPAGWVQLDNEQVVLPANESRKVRGTVSVPYNAGATHTVIIMVEPVVEGAETGVNFKVRYAVKLNINIERPGYRPEAELADFEFQTRDGEMPLINALFRNTSPLHYDVSAELTIRDEKRRLIERVDLRTPVAWQSGRSSTRIFPGAEVLFTAEVEKALFPGKYSLRLFFRYADGRQIIQSREILIEEGDFPERSLNPVELSPQEMDVSIRPGASSSMVVNLENRTDDVLSFRIKGREIEPEYSYSLYRALELNVRGSAEEVEIEPGSSKRLILTVSAPRETAAAGYYGYLDFLQIAEGGIVEQHPILLKAVVQGEQEAVSRIELENLYYYLQEGFYTFVLEMKNTGNYHLSPEGEVIFRDKEGQVVAAVEFAGEEAGEELLPLMFGRLLSKELKIEPGEYIAELRLWDDDNVEVFSEEIAVEIKKED